MQVKWQSGRGALASSSGVANKTNYSFRVLFVCQIRDISSFGRAAVRQDLVRTGNRHCSLECHGGELHVPPPHVRLWLSTRARALRSLPGVERVRQVTAANVTAAAAAADRDERVRQQARRQSRAIGADVVCMRQREMGGAEGGGRCHQ